MGYLYKGDAILKGNLSVATDKPLDNRSVVQNTTELLTIDSEYAYNGMLIVSIDDKSIYILLDKTNISNLSGWQKIGNVVIDGNEIDLSSFVTTKELEAYSTSEEIDNIYAKKTEIPAIPNFKTINGQEIIGEGDITIQSGGNSLIIDDELTETSSNPVKSSGIYNGIKTMINAKFVVLTEVEYNAMATHDANTFYYIKQ